MTARSSSNVKRAGLTLASMAALVALAAACNGMTEEGFLVPEFTLSCFEEGEQDVDAKPDELLVGESLNVEARGYVGPLSKAAFAQLFPTWRLSPTLGSLDPKAALWSATTNPVARTRFTATRAGAATLSLNCDAGVDGHCPGQPPRCKIIVFDKQRLDLQVTGSGGGSVTSDVAGIDCPSSCSKDYKQGTLVKLTAKAAAGHHFTGWGGDCQGSAVTAEVRLNSDRACTATFASISTPVSISTNLGGKAATPLQLVTIKVNMDPAKYCFQWYAGPDADKYKLPDSTDTLAVRVIGDQTYHVVVLDKPCAVEVGRAKTEIKMLKAELSLSIWQSDSHVSPGAQVSFKAQAYSGTQKVLATTVYNAANTLWMVVPDLSAKALVTDSTSGAELKLTAPSSGNYWVHFMLQDSAGKYGLRSALLQVK